LLSLRMRSISDLSPRVRRHRLTQETSVEVGGSISACAEAPLKHWSDEDLRKVYLRVCGGTTSLFSGDRGVWVYLRVCGGTTVSTKKAVLKPGLSPRVRRHPLHLPVLAPDQGSISACAEAPHHPDHNLSSLKVYLRVCGGTPLFATFLSKPSGLSPRVRRHRKLNVVKRDDTGSISACAEAPERNRRPIMGLEVYLRVCGGTPATTCQEQDATGLSLRVLRQRATVCRRACSPHILRGSVEKCNPQRRAR